MTLMGLRAVATLVVLLGRCGCSRSHSLRYLSLGVSEPSQGLPQFLSMVQLDDQPIARYDSHTRRMVPLVPWMEEVDKQSPNYRKVGNETLLATEQVFGDELKSMQKLYQQDGGLHTWQVILGCELREDGSKRAYLDYGYDGRDFISFNKETLTWVTAQPQAQKIKEKWEDDPGWSQGNKDYLEETCIEQLQRYLTYGKEALEKTEPPVGKLTHKVVSDNVETLICQAYGFYPKEINATWMRDGEVCKYETFRRNVAPNSDGTYYAWINIEIDPKERDHFQCHMEHAGLVKPLVLAWMKEPANRGLHVGAVLGALAAVILLASGIICWMRHQRKERENG